MNEWAVVTVLITVFGFVVAVVTPIVRLNKTITTLNVHMEGFGKELDKLTADNDKEHDDLWEHEGKQDDKIADHETRIQLIEHK